MHVQVRTSSLKHSIDLRLIDELRVLALHGFQLDCHLLSGVDVRSAVDLTKGAATNFRPHSELTSDAEFHFFQLKIFKNKIGTVSKMNNFVTKIKAGPEHS